MAGETVVIPENNAPATANNLAITDEQISLTGTGSFTGNGTTSFDAATTLTGAGGSTMAFLDDNFVNNGTITNVAFANNTADNANGSDVINAGTISYTMNTSATEGGNYIDGSGSIGATFFDDGVFNVISQPGASNTTPPSGVMPPIPTSVEWGSAFAGTGVVNIVGGTPNTTTPIMFQPNGGQQQAFMQFDSGAPVTGNVTFNLNDGYVTFSSATKANFNFQDASGVVRFASGTDISAGNTITGFRAGDILGIGTAVNAAGLSYNATTDVLSYTDTAGKAISFTITPTGNQVYTTASFVVNNGGVDGYPEPAITTTAAAPCYCPGTLIRTEHGEALVEDLAIGDRVVTVNGAEEIVWIGRRSFDGRFIQGKTDVLPVCIRAGALGEHLPRRHLWISPLHAMFLDGALVPAQALVNGVSIIQAETVERVDYIHIELAKHSVIWAEGAPSETFVDDHSRGMFHNAAEFAALYPGRPRIAAAYCAPRIKDGEALDTIKRAIDQRAGCDVPGLGEPIDGRVDGVAGSYVWGWAVNPAKPDLPVCVEIVVDGVVVSRALACQFRKDLAEAGLGHGRLGFDVELPSSAAGRDVQVRRVSDGALLRCPWRLAA